MTRLGTVYACNIRKQIGTLTGLGLLNFDIHIPTILSITQRQDVLYYSRPLNVLQPMYCLP